MSRDGSQASNSGRSFDTCTTRRHYTTTSILSRKSFACIRVRSRSRDFYTIYFGGVPETRSLPEPILSNRVDISRGCRACILRCNQPRLRYVDHRKAVALIARMDDSLLRCRFRDRIDGQSQMIRFKRVMKKTSGTSL